MFKIYNIEKDASVFSDFPTRNSGLNQQGYVYSSSYNSLTHDFTSDMKQAIYYYTPPTNIDYNNISSVYLRFNISNYVKKIDSDYTVRCYRLNSSFDEGFGSFSDSQQGITWNNQPTSSNDMFPINIDEENNFLTVNLTNHYLAIVSESVSQTYGFKIVSESGELPLLSFYSKDTLSTLEPKMFVFYNQNHIIQTGSAIQFTSSLHKSHTIISPFRYNRILKEGDIFRVDLDISFQYVRNNFSHDSNIYFLDDLYYYIKNTNTGKIFLESKYENRVLIDGGNAIEFSTKHFPVGKYQIIIYSNTYSAKPIDFVIVEK